MTTAVLWGRESFTVIQLLYVDFYRSQIIDLKITCITCITLLVLHYFDMYYM